MLKGKLIFATLVFMLSVACSSSDSDDEEESSDKSTFTLKGAGSGSTDLLASSPSVAKLTVYQFAISKNKDCSDPVVVFSEASGKEVDMEEGPTLGSGDVDNGAYECVIMEMDDEITFTPSETDGSCTADTEYSINVCRQFQEGTTIKSTLLDGSEVTCTDDKEKIAVYISTYSANSSDTPDPFNAPESNNSDSGIKLSSKLVVSAAITGQFKMDTTDKVDGSNDECDLQPPVFGFTKVNANSDSE